MSVRSRDQIKNHSKHHDRSNEFECKTYSPTVDDGRGTRPRVVASGSQKMETDQVPQSDLPLVQKMMI